jgi:hypothetical protein
MPGSESETKDQNPPCHVPGCAGWSGVPATWIQLDLADPADGDPTDGDDAGAPGSLPDAGDPDCSCRGTGVSIVCRPFPDDRRGPFVIARCTSCDVFHDDCAAALFINELLKARARGL